MNNCKHCQEPCKNSFCCPGCETAYHIIGKLNLNNYYDYCNQLYNRKPNKIIDLKNSLNYDDHIKIVDDHYEIYLLVEGIHCGSCIWLIESTLMQSGALEARINMSTKRLLLKWNGDRAKLNNLLEIIEKIGYKLIPFTRENKINANKELETSLLKSLFVSGFAFIAMMMTLWGVWAGTMDGSIGTYMRFSIQIVSSLIAIPSIIYSAKPFVSSAF